MPDITGITVIVQIDGKTCLVPIRADAARLFMGMLPAFQRGGEDGKQAANLIVMPPDVAQHILAFGAALEKHWTAQKRNREARRDPDHASHG